MSDSYDAERRKTGRLVDSHTFVQFLFHEIARYERYRHSFAVLLIEAPDDEDDAARRMDLRSASGSVRDLLRACDLMAPFDNIGVLAVLLPETTLAGARTVLDRFTAQARDLGPDWTLKLAAYPDHAGVVDQMLAITQELAQEGQAAPEPTPERASEPSFIVPSFQPPPRPRLRASRHGSTPPEREEAG